jgi:1-deoxy-D-xylulose-5-phosphate synthase
MAKGEIFVKILNNVNYPEDVRKLNIKEKEILAKELREKIIFLVSKTGGHLASNLGVVELTIALHSVFNTPMDKIVWDVGHQTYVHKMLTGRKEKLESLRKLDGISGFPKTNESIYDNFNTGHSSTSISIGLGFARVRDIKKENHKVVAVIGDGALTGGMALEALNDLGSSKTDMLVLLNDNEMSISKNVGGISLMLSKIRTQNLYVNTNIKGKRKISKIPFVGKKIVKLVQKTKRSIKQFVIPKMYFEDIGFRYLGPVDGHNIEELENMMELAKKQSGPIVLHVITKKGKGYEYAEKNPDKFHGISKFDVEAGEKIGKRSEEHTLNSSHRL